jgi:hypothetical protein
VTGDVRDGLLADADGHEVALPDELPASDYCELTVDVFCPYYLRCGRMAAADLAACRAIFLESCSARYEPIYQALAERGALALSRAGLLRCRAHLETVACEAQIFDLDGGCDALWRGQVPAGGGCAPGIESFVCDGASTCVIGLDLCGRCVALAAPGQACDAEHRCDSDALCDEGVCVARAAVGAACDPATRCVLGADCEAATCQGPTIVAVGAACDQARRCPYRAACAGGRCVETALLGEACGAAGCASGACADGTCVPWRAPGAPCEDSAACLSGRCVQGACAGLVSPCLDAP